MISITGLQSVGLVSIEVLFVGNLRPCLKEVLFEHQELLWFKNHGCASFQHVLRTCKTMFSTNNDLSRDTSFQLTTYLYDVF